MNVFDVLREKLEESQERYDDVAFAEMNENGHTLDFEYANGKKDGVSESIEIVNQVEQEFGNPIICYLSSPCEYQTEDVNHNNGWIPCSERLPVEHDSVFARFVGTDKWNNYMFKKISDTVNITVADDKGQSVTTHAYLVDGEWSCELLECHKEYRVTAWQPLPDPYKITI